MMNPAPSSFNRKYLSVLFKCCKTYSRVYINAEGTAYTGRCPRCLYPFTAVVDPSGTSSRAFRLQ